MTNTQMSIYYQCGNKDCHDLLASAGEQVMPAYRLMLDRFDIPDIPIDAKHLLSLIQRQNLYREKLADAWEATKMTTATGQPIDGLLCPVSPVAGYPHDFLPWWGYTSVFNLVDYPSTVLPVHNIKINENDDAKNMHYTPLDNAFDQDCYNICELETALSATRTSSTFNVLKSDFHRRPSQVEEHAGGNSDCCPSI